jgi:hypothetical protein
MNEVLALSAFVDLAAAQHEEGLALWERLTGYQRSAARGPDGEFVTLVPADGDGFLRVQRLGSGASRVHLDLHVEEPRAAALEALGLGATMVAEEIGYLTLASPGGFVFCFVPHAAGDVPRATTWPDGNRSRVDQVCLDIPPSAYDREFAFWEDLTSWEARPLQAGNEFARLTPPAGQPLKLLLQRLDADEPAVRAHLDWCATDRDAEAERQVGAGATLVERFDRGWTVMAGPDGFEYCITGRAPEEGS